MRLILPAALLVALASCGGGGGNGKHPSPLVGAAAVTSMRFVDRIEAVGTAHANEQVTLSAPVTERIVRINFEDGGYVRAGQVIAELAQGQEDAQLADARARAREADQQLRRLEKLKSSGFATNASVDAQLAQAASARAQAAEASASIGDRVVRAPFAGWASLRTISAGAVVSAGTPIATISDLSEIKLDFPVPETLLSALAPGQTIEARAAAFPAQIFHGRIATINPVVDPATRSVMVRAILPNPGNRLKSGMLLTVVIESAARAAPMLMVRVVIRASTASSKRFMVSPLAQWMVGSRFYLRPATPRAVASSGALAAGRATAGAATAVPGPPAAGAQPW